MTSSQVRHLERVGDAHINGQWRDGDGDALDVTNPATGEVIASVTTAGEGLVDQAMASARAAFAGWSATTPERRAAFLEAWAAAIDTCGGPLAHTVSSEMGMPIAQSRVGQVDLPARVLRSLAACGRDVEWDHVDGSGTSVLREAAGVVLAITPWNFPVHQIAAKVGAALMAGCTVVLKPAELAPLNALLLADLAQQAGLPDGVLNVVNGTGPTTGELLLQSRAYDVVSFTGSLAVGRHIGEVAGRDIVRATLELGGKSPALVLPGASLAQATRTTVANAFINAGQKCNAPTRLLVPHHQVSAATDLAVAAAREFVLGDPLDEQTTMGPLVSQAQRVRVQGFLERAREDSARVQGGEQLPGAGFFLTPAVVSDVDPNAEIAREEVFGPVLVVLGYHDEADAVRLANDSEYGLSAEVWAKDADRARAVARELRAGQVRLNGARTPALPVSPFGGYKRSGLGRELGSVGIEEFVELKSVLA